MKTVESYFGKYSQGFLDSYGQTWQAIAKDNLTKIIAERDQEWRDKIEAKIKGKIGKSTHGNCCSCTACHNYHDECKCAEITALKELLEEK
jgi:hypothetical protein